MSDKKTVREYFIPTVPQPKKAGLRKVQYTSRHNKPFGR